MDWIKDVEERFGNLKELKDLKDRHFTGSVKLNFSNGSVNTCEMFAKRIVTVSVSNANSTFSSVTIVNENLFV